ncbi:DUF2339 domain-containing protein, partial [bacterium]|nr:DUF2339 domain-containing protein [bacterium]
DIPQSFIFTNLSGIILATVVSMTFFIMNLECYRTVNHFYPPLIPVAMTLIWIGLAVYLLHFKTTDRKDLLNVLFNFVLAGLFIKFIVFDMAALDANPYLLRYVGKYSFLQGFIRLLYFGSLCLFALYTWKVTGREKGPQQNKHKMFGWISIVTLFIFTTFELNTILHTWLRGFRDGGLSILWSVFALSLLFIGIRTSNRSSRYCGLALFSIVIGKVFFFDLDRLEAVWRIVAFMILGILVLCGSFVYLKYKGDFISNDDTEQAT